MKITKPIENWTRFPNCILDHIEKFTPQEFAVLAYMVRKNIGWNNSNKKFSNGYIGQNVGMSRPTVRKAVTGLLEKGSIIEVGCTIHGERLYDVNWIEPIIKPKSETKTTEESEPLLWGGGKDFATPLANTLPPPGKDFATLKDTTKKETIGKKEEAQNAPSPFCMIRDAYFSLYEQRFKIKPSFNGAQGQAIKNLLKQYDPGEILDNLERYFATDDDFYRKQGYTILYFQRAIDGLRLKNAEKRDCFIHSADEYAAEAAALGIDA